MCSKPPKPKPVKEKEPQYLRNPWLDGLAIGGVQGARSGRNALRVDLGTPGAAPNYVGMPSARQPLTPATGAYSAASFGGSLFRAIAAGLATSRSK